MTGPPEHYLNASVATVQCPRCGQARDAPLVARLENSVEFAVVCSTPTEHGGFCSTTLHLTTTAHVFPGGHDPGS